MTRKCFQNRNILPVSGSPQDCFYPSDEILRFATAEYLSYKLLQRGGTVANLLTADKRLVHTE